MILRQPGDPLPQTTGTADALYRNVSQRPVIW